MEEKDGNLVGDLPYMFLCSAGPGFENDNNTVIRRFPTDSLHNSKFLSSYQLFIYYLHIMPEVVEQEQ